MKKIVFAIGFTVLTSNIFGTTIGGNQPIKGVITTKKGKLNKPQLKGMHSKLMKSIVNKDLNSVKQIMECLLRSKDFSPSKFFSQFLPNPLFTAVSLNNTEISEYLLQKGASANWVSSIDMRPMLMHLSQAQALENGDGVVDNEMESMNLLLPENLLRLSGLKGITPLAIAIDNQNEVLVKSLIDHGADVNRTVWDNVSPLNLAIGSRNKTILNHLIEANPRINADPSVYDPLLFALHILNIDAIGPLVKLGVKINSVFENDSKFSFQFSNNDADDYKNLSFFVEKSTPLIFNIKMSYINILDIFNYKPKSPEYFQILKSLKERENILKSLIKDFDADPNLPDGLFVDPLNNVLKFYYCLKDFFPENNIFAQRLINQTTMNFLRILIVNGGANIYLLNKSGYTPLDIAKQRKDQEIINYMISLTNYRRWLYFIFDLTVNEERYKSFSLFSGLVENKEDHQMIDRLIDFANKNKSKKVDSLVTNINEFLSSLNEEEKLTLVNLCDKFLKMSKKQSETETVDEKSSYDVKEVSLDEINKQKLEQGEEQAIGQEQTEDLVESFDKIKIKDSEDKTVENKAPVSSIRSLKKQSRQDKQELLIKEFFEKVQNSDLKVIQKAVSSNQKFNLIDAKDKGNRSPLMIALENNREDVAQWLINRKVNLTRKDNAGNTALIYAVKSGNPSLVKAVLYKLKGQKSKYILWKNSKKESALTWAIFNNYSEITDFLLKHLSIEQKTDVMSLAMEKGYWNIAQIAVAGGAYVNKQDQKGNTPLLLALEAKEFDFAEMLINTKGVDVNLKNQNNHTALSFAISKVQTNDGRDKFAPFYIEVVKSIFRANASVEKQQVLETIEWANTLEDNELSELLRGYIAQSEEVEIESENIENTSDLEDETFVVDQSEFSSSIIDQEENEIIESNQLGNNEVISEVNESNLSSVNETEANISRDVMDNNEQVFREYEPVYNDQNSYSYPQPNFYGPEFYDQNIQWNMMPVYFSPVFFDPNIQPNIQQNVIYPEFNYYAPVDGGYYMPQAENVSNINVFEVIRSGDIKKVRQFINEGGGITYKDSSGKNAWFFTVNLDENSIYCKQILQVLLSSQLNIDEKDKQGQTALIHAVKNNKRSIADFLLANEANVNAVDIWGKTPLMYAIENQNRSMIHLLLSKKPKLDLLDNNGQIALFYSVRKKDIKTTKILLECTTKHNERGIDNVDIFGKTPLMYAIENRDYSMINLLLSQRPKLWIADKHKHTALFYSVRKKDLQATRMLLEFAAKYNRKDIAKVDVFGKTVLDYAIESENKNLENLIMQYSAEKSADQRK